MLVLKKDRCLRFSYERLILHSIHYIRILTWLKTTDTGTRAVRSLWWQMVVTSSSHAPCHGERQEAEYSVSDLIRKERGICQDIFTRDFCSLSRFCDAKYIRGEPQSSVWPGVSCVRCISIECNVVLLAPLCNYYNNITAGGAGCRHRRYHGAQLSSWSTGACISVTPVITLLTSPHFLSYPVRPPDVPGERSSR